MLIGYARVSTKDQDRAREALERLRAHPHLSRDVAEIVGRALA